jgi:MFS family permease
VGGGVLAALCVAAFLAALNFFATTPFYPAMAPDLHTTVPLLGQLVTLMVLSSAGLGLVVGLGDHYGYRWPLVIGVLAIAAKPVGHGTRSKLPRGARL